MKHPLVLREKIYVPVTRSFDLEELEDDFTVNIFDEKGCEPCEFRDARLCYECKECPNWQSTTRLYKEKHVKGVRYVGLPYGMKRRIPEFFPYVENLDVVDKRACRPFRPICALRALCVSTKSKSKEYVAA